MLRSRHKAFSVGRGLDDWQRSQKAGFNPNGWDPLALAPARIRSSNLLFYDLFMDPTLDTTSKWSRTQSTAGNVEVDTTTANRRCNLKGNGTWGNNGAFTIPSWAKATGLTFQCDVILGPTPSGVAVGFHDGAGVSYADFAHCIDFYAGGSGFHVFENGTSRGDVGSGGTQNWGTYRVRMRLSSATACTYQIQGCQFAGFGTTTFTTLSPSSSSSATTPLRVGFATEGSIGGNDHWIRNVLVYLS